MRPRLERRPVGGLLLSPPVVPGHDRAAMDATRVEARPVRAAVAAVRGVVHAALRRARKRGLHVHNVRARVSPCAINILICTHVAIAVHPVRLYIFYQVTSGAISWTTMLLLLGIGSSRIARHRLQTKRAQHHHATHAQKLLPEQTGRENTGAAARRRGICLGSELVHQASELLLVWREPRGHVAADVMCLAYLHAGSQASFGMQATDVWLQRPCTLLMVRCYSC